MSKIWKMDTVWTRRGNFFFEGRESSVFEFCFALPVQIVLKFHFRLSTVEAALVINRVIRAFFKSVKEIYPIM